MSLFSWLYKKKKTAIKPSKEYDRADPVLDGFKITIRNIENKLSQVEKELSQTKDRFLARDLKKQRKFLKSLRNHNQIMIFLKLVKDQEQRRLKELEKERAERRENRISRSLERDQRRLAGKKTHNINFGGVTIKYTLKRDEKTGETEIKIKEITREKTPKTPKNKSTVVQHVAIGSFTKAVIDEEEESSHSPSGAHGI